MNSVWLKSVIPIAALFSFRMLGLFMLIPVFTLYAPNLNGATPALIGLALGSYGLTQGILQIPFGILSDRYGRKPVITVGLLLFACGSVIGAFTHTIYGMILARTLQGTGAVGSVLIAFLADLTPDEKRVKAMAVVGGTIGLSFSLAMIVSPIITSYFGLSGIFYLTTLLALLGLVLLHAIIPTPLHEPFHHDNSQPALFKEVLHNPHLLRLNASIFFQHLVFTATFFAIPILLQKQIQQSTFFMQHWHFYLPIIIFSFILMIPFIVIAEKRNQIKKIFLSAVTLTLFSQILLGLVPSTWISICGLMLIYFTAFNLLEATIPSLVSRQSMPTSKGTAMGVYSSCQFLGIFVGGVFAGLVYPLMGVPGIFLINALLCFIWLSFVLGLKPNAYQTTLVMPWHQPGQFDESIKDQLKVLEGVIDVIFSAEKRLLYLKVNKATFNEKAYQQLSDELSKAVHSNA